MKLKYSIFLSKANLHGSKRKNTVTIMMILSVASLILLAGFIAILTDVLNVYNENIRCRQILVSPEIVYPESAGKGVNEKTKDEVLKIDHVVSCEKELYSNYQASFVQKIKDENGKDITESLGELTPEKIASGINTQFVDSEFSSKIIKGEQLRDAPVMSCIAPDYGYPYRESKFDASELLGKTLTVKVPYRFDLYIKGELGGYKRGEKNTVEITYDLMVVGIYHYANEGAYGGVAFLISPETAEKIENLALKKAKDNDYDLEEYINDPYSRNQIVTVDKQENAKEVEDKLCELGYMAHTVRSFDPAAAIFINFFKGAGIFLLGAILLLMCINIFLSVYANINARRPEIGLMKALGYKTSQIFKSMYMENVILAVRALIVGLAISAIVSIVVNAINLSNEELLYHSYVMSWQMFGIMSLIALAMILTVPLICQLVMLNKIAKIQPQEAMNS